MEEITQIISSVGFPIAMCLIMGYWVKTTHDDHREDYRIIQEKHAEEGKILAAAINNNTLVIERLINKLEGEIYETAVSTRD